MATDVILTLPQAINALLRFAPDIGWMFRGQSNAAWPLLPKAGRSPFFRSSLPVDPSKKASKHNPPPDLGRFNHWRHLAKGYPSELPVNDFECLAYAQHYGLPTRLLDFSETALAALFFACESNFGVDGAVYAYCPWDYVDNDVANIYEFPKVAAMRVPPFDRRILAQQGIFVYFPDPAKPLEPAPLKKEIAELSGTEANLVKITIPAGGKLIIHRQLRDVGVTRRLFFPDMDGLSHDFMSEDYYRHDFDKQFEARKEAARSSSSNS